MLKNNRIQCFISILIVISLGITSRKTTGVPTFFGDVLYAVMVYYVVRMVFIRSSKQKTALLALSFCFCIEFFQLYQAEWMLEIRNTTLGHYVLGQGFLWSDLGFYTLGIAIAFIVDFKIIKTR